MTNEHVELVKKWRADKDSVSLEELEDNDKAACKAYLDAEGYLDAVEAAHLVADHAAYYAGTKTYVVKAETSPHQYSYMTIRAVDAKEAEEIFCQSYKHPMGLTATQKDDDEWPDAHQPDAVIDAEIKKYEELTK